MTIQARNKIIAGKLLELYNLGKRLKEEQTLSQQYKNWLEGEQALSQQYRNWLDDVLNFINTEVDEDTEEEFSLGNTCFQSNCGNIYDLEELVGLSIKYETTEYYENMLNIIKFYIPVFSGKPFKDVDSNESFEESKDMIKTKKLFISHSSKDKAIVDQFVNFLSCDLGLVAEEEYFYSSEEDSGVSLGESIDDRLRSELNNNDCLFVAMFSRNYFESYACWFELGVRWGKGLKLLGIVIDPDEDVQRKSINVSKDVRIITYNNLINRSKVRQEIQDKVFEHLEKQNSPKNGEYSKFYDEFLRLVREHSQQKDKH